MKNTKHNDDAVSPVIGVILMVAIKYKFLNKFIFGENRHLGGSDRSLRIRLSGWNAEH